MPVLRALSVGDGVGFARLGGLSFVPEDLEPAVYAIGAEPRAAGRAPVRLVLGISFGVVMADLAFGGRGRHVPAPAVVTLAFPGYGFPAAPGPGIAVAVG